MQNIETIELLNIVEFSIKHAYDKQRNSKLKLIEYFSLTDLKPNELAGLGYNCRGMGKCNFLIKYTSENYFALVQANVQNSINGRFVYNGYELTLEEKMDILEKLKSEGYPMLEGIVNEAKRLYIDEGIDAISKEKIKERLLKNYNENAFKEGFTEEYFKDRATGFKQKKKKI